jgi:hypothetical protein
VLTLRTFGECRIDVGRAGTPPLALAPNADRLFSLALLLAGEAGRPVPRARAAGWLWPELGEPAARRCLRQALYRLRAAGVPVEAAADHLRLPTAAVATTFDAAPDVARLADTWQGGRLRLGACLPGWSPASGAFREWVDAYRARQEAAARTAVRAALRTEAEPAAAAALADALLALDASDGDAARVLAPGDAAPPHPDHRADAPTLPLIGRAALVGALSARVREAYAGRGGALCLAGAPGVGTSRLLDTVVAIAARLGAAVVRTRGAGAHGGSLDVCRTLTARLLERPGALGAAPATIAALRRFATARCATTPRAFATVGGPSAADRLLGDRLAELAGAVAAERPLVLAVDDAGAADRHALGVLARAAAALGGEAVLVVWTAGETRPTDADAPTTVERWPVPPLGRGAAAALARAAAAVRGTLSDADAAWCATTGRGVPGDVIALARHCAATPGARTAPPALAARHAARVAALPSAARRALRTAALLGRHATAARIARAVDPDVRRGRRTVAALVGTGLLRSESSGRVTPAHPFLADAALAAPDAGGRRALHAAVAAALDHDARTALAAGDADAGDVAVAAAAHWRSARDAGRATGLLADARTTLLAAGRAGEAATLLARALDDARAAARLDTPAARRRNARALADVGALAAGALFALGDARAAAAMADRGRGDRAPASDRAELVAIQSAWRAGRAWPSLLARARRLAVDVCAGTAERLEAAALAAALADNGVAGPLGGRLADVGAALDALVDRSDVAHPLALRATMIYHVAAGDLGAGVDAAAALMRLLLARPLAVDELGPLLAVADALRAGGDVDGAARVYAQVHAAAARRGLAGYAARAALRTAALACACGDAPVAGPWARDGAGWVARTADERLAWELADVRARVLLALGDPAADAAAGAALDRVRGARSTTPRLWRAALTTAGEARLAAGGWRPGAPPAARRAGGRLLAALLRAHHLLAARTGHDRTAAACAAALLRLGAEDRAARLAHAYLAGPRRALGAPPPALAALATPDGAAAGVPGRRPPQPSRPSVAKPAE